MRLAFGLGLALAAGTAQAVVIDTYPDWDGNITNGWQKVAQSFTAPSDNILKSWKFATAEGQSHITFTVHTWSNSSGETSGPLFTTHLDGSAGGDLLVDNINLALTVGQLYAVVLNLNGNAGQSIHWQTNQNSYNQGDASWFDGSTWQYLDSGWNTKFRAELVPEPASVAAMALGLAALSLRRRRR